MLTFFERWRLRFRAFSGRIPTTRLVVGVLIQKDGKYLLLDEHRKEGIRLNIPAGHVDPKETPIEAAKREAKEESGFDVRLTGIRLALTQTWKQGTHSVYWVFDGEVAGGELQTEAGSKAQWLTLSEWEVHMNDLEPMPILPHVIEAVKKNLSIKTETVYFMDRRSSITREVPS